MAINKKVQFLRNNSIYTGATGAAARTAAIAGMRGIATGSTTSGEIVDGQAILARYNAAGSASTGDVQTIYGIVHKGVNSKTGVTVYESSELLWAAINENVSTSTTISAGTGLSGGGQLNAETVTLSHKSKTVSRVADQENTPITSGTFTAVTGITDDGLGHMSMIKSAVFELPVDSAVTQEQLTASTSHPIILKVDDSASASARNKVYFSSAATIDKTGNIKTSGNMSATTVSGTTVKGVTVSATSAYGETISATTYLNLPASADVKVAQSGMTALDTDNYPILLKPNTTATDFTGGTYFSNDVTIDKSGNLSAKTSVKSAAISGGSVTASGNVRGGNVSADTISAATHVKSPTISGGSVTASGNIRGGNVSANTISAATHVKAPTISATSAYGATISGGTYLNLPAATSAANGVVKVVETTGATTGNTVMSQKAVTDAITGMISVADALVYKGTVAGTATSPGASLPAANKGDVYKVSTSGYVAGVKVEVGDMFICNTDNTASGTASTNWDVIQTNVDMANYVQTARTVTAGTGLSGGGNLGSDVTIRHKTVTVNTLTDQDTTSITDRTFTAVTAITDDGMGHMSSVKSAVFELPSASDSAVTQTSYTGTSAQPLLTKNGTGSGSVTTSATFVTAATIDGSGNIKTTGNVSGATISGANIYGATAISGANITAATAVRAGNVSAGTISAGTGIRAGNVSAGTITAATDLRAGNVSAATISAATHVKSATISGTNVYGPTISGGSLTVTGTVTAKDVTASTSVKSPSISGTSVYGPTISGTNITAANLVTASGFTATANASTASTDIDASILLSNGKNTNIIDCGTY